MNYGFIDDETIVKQAKKICDCIGHGMHGTAMQMIIETAERLGVHRDSLRNWIKKYQSPEAEIEAKKSQDTQAEIKRLQKELKRVTFLFYFL